MGGNSGGGGRGGRSGGSQDGGSPADAGQPGEVFREANIKVKRVLVSGGSVTPQAKAYDAAQKYLENKPELTNYQQALKRQRQQDYFDGITRPKLKKGEKPWSVKNYE